MTLHGMAVVILSVVVAAAFSSVASAAYTGPPTQQAAAAIQCGTSQEVKDSLVTLPNSTVAVTCNTSNDFKPQIEQSTAAKQVCSDPGCQTVVNIDSLCPGATIMGGSQKDKATITIPQLPTTQQVFYLQCQSSSQLQCTAKITVQAAKPEGPQSCAVPGGSVTLQIQQEGGTAYFGCGTGWSVYPSEPTKAYSEDCTKDETLKDLTRSTTTQGNYVALTASKKKKKKLCFVCKQPGGPKLANGEGCKVYVDVSGSTPLLSGLAVAVTLPCVMALLHIT